MFKIKVSYETGCTAYKEDVEKDLEQTWKNLDIAKQNLVRIKEHYQYATYINNPKYRDPIDCPEFLIKYWGKSYLPKPIYYDNKYESLAGKINSFEYKFELEYYVPLLLDDLTEYKQGADWVGYFETLYGACITQREEDGWSFSL